MTRRKQARRRHHLGRALAVGAVVALALASSPRDAHAQAACGARDAERAGAVQRWPSPLDRPVVLHGRDVSLRDALDRLAAAARIRLSYSGDLLPLDRAVCLAVDSVAAGDALTAMLRGMAVEPVVTGTDQVVLAPERASAASTGPSISPRINVLDRVVVTGSAVGASQRPLTIALDVIAGPQLARRDARSLATALDGAVPGLWMWEQAPSTLLARYGSIRGASSFGMTYPKIYIDGIEVANPLLLTRLEPEAIDRVEVIRGPQGAALYGADAISGVVNIVTRHAPRDSADGHATLRSEMGMVETAFAERDAMVQRHVLTLDGGSNQRSAGLTIGAGSMGEFVPGAFSHDVQGIAGVRLVGSRASVTGTARFYATEAGAAANPLVAGGMVASSADRAAVREMSPATAPMTAAPDDSGPQGVRQYTLGTTVRFAASDRWQHSLVVGMDGYRLRNVATDDVPLPSSVDSALRAAGGGADRATVRASSVAHFGATDRTAAAISFGVEHTALREMAVVDRDGGGRIDEPRAAAPETTLWRSTTGVLAQGDVSLLDALFVTAGARLERNDALAGGSQLTTLPMVGVALVRDYGPLTAKLRAAYGRGMRPPSVSVREIAWGGLRRPAGAPPLSPEEQAGTEAGVDLLVGSAFGLHVTRFDQRAFGLIQPVAIADSATAPAMGSRSMSYELQNVGEIGNRGWELQAAAHAGAFSLSAATSVVESRVRRIAPGYTGDLLPGDRMLGVPGRTASGVLGWNPAHWSATVSLSRASDWWDYDRLALAQAWAGGVNPRQLTGAQLRTYWRDYPGVTRLGASFSRDLTRGFSLVLTGDNLLNRQRGEPDDITIVPGRTVAAGLRAAF